MRASGALVVRVLPMAFFASRASVWQLQERKSSCRVARDDAISPDGARPAYQYGFRHREEEHTNYSIDYPSRSKKPYIDRFLRLSYTARPSSGRGEMGEGGPSLVLTNFSRRRDNLHTNAGAEGLTLKRILTAQLGTFIVVVFVLYVIAPSDVRSALFGAGISVAGNGYAAWRVFSRQATGSGESELFTLYRAEFGKLVIVGVLCAAVFVAVDEIRIAGFLAGLLAGMIAATVAVVTQKVQLPVNEDT